MKNLTIAARVWILLGISAIVLGIVMIAGVIYLSKVNTNIGSIYNDRVVPLEQLKVISDEYAVNIVDCSHKARNGNMTWESALSLLASAEKKINEHWAAYLNTSLTVEEKQLAGQVEEGKKRANVVFQKIETILKSGKSVTSEAELESLVKTELFKTLTR